MGEEELYDDLDHLGQPVSKAEVRFFPLPSVPPLLLRLSVAKRVWLLDCCSIVEMMSALLMRSHRKNYNSAANEN